MLRIAIVGLLVVFPLATRPELACGYWATPDDPTAAIAGRTARLTNIHDKYHAAAAAFKEQAATAADSTQKLTQKLNAATAEYRSLMQQSSVAQANVNDANGQMREALNSYRTETRWEAERVAITDPNTGRRSTEIQRVKKIVRVPKKPFEQQQEIAAARKSLADAQGTLDQVVAQGQQVETLLKQGPQQLQQLRMGAETERRLASSLADDWLDLIDRGRELSTPEHQAIISLCDAWIDADSHDAPALLARGTSRRWLNDPQARADLDDVVRVGGPFQKQAILTRGILRSNLGDAPGGLSELGPAVKQRDPRVYQYRALIYCRQERFAAAATDLKVAIRNRPEDPEPLCLLALLYAVSATGRDATQSLFYAQRACDLTKSKDWTCLDALAAAQAEAGQFDEAVKTIGQASDLTFADKRQQCLDRKKLYEQRQPLRLDWK